MALRRQFAFVLVGVFFSMGATYRTTNFVVIAPTPQIAESVGRCRALSPGEGPGLARPGNAELAAALPALRAGQHAGPRRSDLVQFGPGGVASQNMEIKGPLDRLFASVLPHEVTHTVFAYHFRRAVPRWADEGGAVLSEDDIERERHDKIIRQHPQPGAPVPPAPVVQCLKEYPPNGEKVMCLYAQGFSVSDYLVKRKDRQTFLPSSASACRGSGTWRSRRCYGHRTVEELEEAWLKHLRDTRSQPFIQLAQNNKQQQPQAETASRVVVRLTAPPRNRWSPLRWSAARRRRGTGRADASATRRSPPPEPRARPGRIRRRCP